MEETKTERMKAASTILIILLSSVCLIGQVQCHVGGRNDLLRKFIQAPRLRRRSRIYSTAAVSMSTEHSPVYMGLQDGLKDADKIEALPGQPRAVKLNQFGGYVTVDPNTGKALFYYFVESHNSSSKPLVLWLNGGNFHTT